MSDDKLLRMLGEVAAQQRRDGEASVWERLSRGELSPEEIAALEQGAESPDDQRRLSAARPIDAAAQERIARTLASRLAPIRRPRWRRHIGFATGGLALAAGLLLFMINTRTGDLPAYELEASGSSSSRALPATPAVQSGCSLRADSHGSFELVARPPRAVDGAIAAHAFLARGDDVEPWIGTIQISSMGTVQLLDERQKLVGATELRIVLGRADRLTREEAQTLARTTDAAPRGTQVFRCSVVAPSP